jgi:hypothetical protein
MKPLNTTCAGTAISCGLLAISPAQESVHTLDPLYVRAQSLTEPWSLTEHIVGSSHLRHTDAASLVRNLPGAAVVRNGSQTGILQIRGLTGQRVSVKVDGMTITPACPNHMDPPLHYANPATGDQVLCVVQKFSGGASGIDLYLRDARDARPATEGNATPFKRVGSMGAFTSLKIEKVNVDPLGRIATAAD